MNKDTIYIEPEDDITDIITKIEKSKEKIVALVPPKKAGVFRSIVNIKLIAKAGVTSDKKVVLVTSDPSIMKLAGATKLPVAKTLQSAPSIPSTEEEATPEEEISDIVEPDEEEDADTEEEAKDEKANSAKDKKEGSEPKEEEEDDDNEEETEDDEEEEPEKTPAKKAKNNKKSLKLSGNKVLDWIKLHKKLSIFCGIAGLALIIFLIWAFAIAPAVDIAVAIKTDQEKFSEGITFVDSLTDENAKEGKFYLEQKKLEEAQEVKFEATGQKNVGEKATGEVIIYRYFKDRGAVAVNAGSSFTFNGLSYISSKDASLSWDGESMNLCGNNGQPSIVFSGCLISGKVAVTAANSGTKYNISAQNSGWKTTADVAVYSDSAMSGGTDDIKTVVQQSDIEKAKADLNAGKEEENKAKLYETIDEDSFLIIDASFEQTTSKAESTPAADEEVKGDTKPTLKATTTVSVYVIDKTKLEEYINAKAELEENQKIFEIKDIYIENFTISEGKGSAKLKAKYFVGPKLTESEVVDKIKGKGLGDAQREIRDIYGVSNVTINPAYPWVMTVPGDSNKITVSFEVKDQDGNEIKTQDESQNTNEEDGDKKDENNSDKKDEN